MQTKDLKIILKVAEYQNITAAANSLDITPATASAAIKRVEKDLGASLFIRSTRQLRLSPAGERYLPKCQEALNLLSQAKQVIKKEENIIDGELRLALPSDLGRNLVLPWLDELMSHHHQLKIKIHISDRLGDFYHDPVDIALRYGSPQDNNLYGFKICDVPRAIYATPDYLTRYAMPKHPNDLQQHNALCYQIYDHVIDVWEFSHKDDAEERYKIKVKGNRISNDADVIRRWCLSGRGIAIKSYLDMFGYVKSGEVVPLLPDYKVSSEESSELWLVCPNRQLITPAVRLLRDELKSHCAEIIQSIVR